MHVHIYTIKPMASKSHSSQVPKVGNPELMFTSNIRMGEKFDLSGFDCGTIVGARWAGWNISETTDLLGFSHATVSRVYSEWCEKQKQFHRRKCLVDERGQRRKARLVGADRKATGTQINTMLYNCGKQKSISECTIL